MQTKECMTTYSVIMDRRRRLDLAVRCIWQLWMVDKGLDPGRAAGTWLSNSERPEGIEVGMHKGEIFDIR